MELKTLRLSVRAENALKRAGVMSVEQLLRFSPQELIEMPYIGWSIAREIMDKLTVFYKKAETERREGRPASTEKRRCR